MHSTFCAVNGFYRADKTSHLFAANAMHSSTEKCHATQNEKHFCAAQGVKNNEVKK
jgi:hypothetical protein